MSETKILKTKIDNILSGVDKCLQIVSDFDSEGNTDKEEFLQEAEASLEESKVKLEDAIDSISEVEVAK